MSFINSKLLLNTVIEKSPIEDDPGTLTTELMCCSSLCHKGKGGIKDGSALQQKYLYKHEVTHIK